LRFDNISDRADKNLDSVAFGDLAKMW
jgi:hypothetical protein